MTSEERREVRYQRRRAAREEKWKRLRPEHDCYEAVFSYANLYRSYRLCRKNVAWKSSVQKYIATAPLNVYQTWVRLMQCKYKSPGFFEFDLFERGKARHIRSTVIGERVVQRCLCDNALNPMMTRTFIYDNGASLTNKGYSFSVRRIICHLQRYYRQHGSDGYILLFDFSRFFDNVSHELLSVALRKRFTDERLIQLTEHFISMFGARGLGLGSQISQTLALVSANRLDHFIKDECRMKYYGRYMDDGYIIHPSKAFLQRLLAQMQKLCDELGIVLNRKKTQIVRLRRGFSWLKIRLYLTPAGKVVRKIYKRSITVMRKKLKRLRRHLDDGLLTRDDIYNSWQSWKAYALNFSSWRTVQSMGKLYDRLFVFEEDHDEIYQGT